jgi:hypothetical protein
MGSACGWGIAWLLWGVPLALFPLFLGITMEIISRRRIPNDASPAIKNHRSSAFWNGVVIGMGLGWILVPKIEGNSSTIIIMGSFPIILGVLMEIIGHRRIDKGD